GAGERRRPPCPVRIGGVERVQNDIGAARRRAARVMVERVDLDDLGVGRRAGRAARPHQARHGPAGVTERLRRRVTEPPGGAEHHNTRTHDRRRARGKAIRVHPASGDGTRRACDFKSHRSERPTKHMSAAIESRAMVPPYLESDKRLPMTEFLVYALVPIAIGAVAVVLLLGLSNMARGGSPHRSQKLMRLRVLLQFIAIIVIMLTIWAIGK